MTLSPQPPTLASLAEQLASLHERIDRQQLEIDDLRRENTSLRTRVAETPDPDIKRSSERTVAAASLTGTHDERMSRRGVLRRAASVAAGTVVAAALLEQQTQEASASHANEQIDVDTVVAHYVQVESSSGFDGVWAVTNTASDNYAGVWGENRGSGPGVVGKSAASIGVIGRGMIGVKGQSSSPGYGANYGLHTDNGFGIVGDGHGAATSGVLGRNADGEGVRGEGKTGIWGRTSSSGYSGVYGENSTTGNGVYGEAPTGAGVRGVSSGGFGIDGAGRTGVHGTGTGSSGYGGLFEGGKAQLRIVPKTTAGKPTSGAHAKGEIVLDSAAVLWVCTVGGTPGIWRKVSTTAY